MIPRSMFSEMATTAHFIASALNLTKSARLLTDMRVALPFLCGRSRKPWGQKCDLKDRQGLRQVSLDQEMGNRL